MSRLELCSACREEPAPTARGVRLCRGCTEVLLRQFEKPLHGDGKVRLARGFAMACRICGEYVNRRVVDHPQWGRICEVDVREAAEIFGMR